MSKSNTYGLEKPKKHTVSGFAFVLQKLVRRETMRRHLIFLKMYRPQKPFTVAVPGGAERDIRIISRCLSANLRSAGDILSSIGLYIYSGLLILHQHSYLDGCLKELHFKPDKWWKRLNVTSLILQVYSTDCRK